MATNRAPRSVSSPATAGRSPDPDDEDHAFRTGRPRRVWKTITAAFVLFALGSLMLYFGVQALNEGEQDRAIAMLVIGSLAFLPGFYATWVIVATLLGLRGYDYHDLPSYDD